MLMDKMTGHNLFLGQFTAFLNDPSLSSPLLKVLSCKPSVTEYLKFFLIFSANLVINHESLLSLIYVNPQLDDWLQHLLSSYLGLHQQLDPEQDPYFEWFFLFLRAFLQKDSNRLKYTLQLLSSKEQQYILMLVFNLFNKVIEERT